MAKNIAQYNKNFHSQHEKNEPSRQGTAVLEFTSFLITDSSRCL